ncbi:hypothetical protein ASE63_05540 [Bosea sp. Root381]|uniref:hypothetical protein n=1 Tax=Bosea sp. Root381 TaxID=1736524 RepID=UPI0006FB0B67|nr:hypothetical protein [Bosea sp. Root381]KRE05789.1 hypothetical protein ASE63_05540 [Bosea sp. Root381]
MPNDEQRKSSVSAVLQRFPTERQTIEQLAARSEDFCDMCEELADAEQAMRAAQMLPAHIRDERTAEWVTLIDRLAAAIDRALRLANVVPISRAKQPKSH